MFDGDFKATWVEFNNQVYVGEDGYVDSIKLNPDPEIAQGRSLAVSHWQDKGMWFFALLNNKCVAVPLSNIRYVYGEIIRANHTGIQTSADAVAEDMPKKRGRPPRDKQ